MDKSAVLVEYFLFYVVGFNRKIWMHIGQLLDACISIWIPYELLYSSFLLATPLFFFVLFWKKLVGFSVSRFWQVCCIAIEAFGFLFHVSVLPDDDWFNDICQDAIERLSGKLKADRDINSPTASVSAQSMSSVRSHGSS